MADRLHSRRLSHACGVRVVNAGASDTDVAAVRRRRGLVLVIVLGGVGGLMLLAAIAFVSSGRKAPIVERPAFEVVQVIQGPGTGTEPSFSRPLGVAWGEDGTILVSDTGNKRVCVFSHAGHFIREFGRKDTKAPGSAGEQSLLEMPAGLDVGEDGSVFVADVKGARVLVFDASGRVERALSLPAEAGWRPVDVAVSGDEILVADQQGVAVFSSDGRPLPRLVARGEERLSAAVGVAVGPDGTVFVSESNRYRVLALGRDGTIRSTIRSASDGAKVFGLPRGVGVFPDGTLLVADAFRFALVGVDASGTVIDRWGSRGNEPGQFSYPNDVDISGDLVLVADKENHRVQVIRISRHR
jgi:DNA-binding beta-propeller fold protein YncE